MSPPSAVLLRRMGPPSAVLLRRTGSRRLRHSFPIEFAIAFELAGGMFIWKMTSEEQPAGPSAASSARPQRSGPSRRRRGFRPSRRPRRPPPQASEVAAKPPETTEDPQAEAREASERFEPGDSRELAEAEAPEARPERPAREPAMHQPPVLRSSTAEGGEVPRRRADAAPAIRQAIEEVQKINRDLESLLLEMEKALETLEEAEVQK